MNKLSIILDYFNELYPNPKTELLYNKDYEFLIAVVLSAQATDKRVNMVTPILFNKYNSLEALKEASLDDLMYILKPVGMYNKKAKFVHDIANTLYDKYNNVVPKERLYLESINGVGRKTANVILSTLYNEPCIAVDTHIDRVSKRLTLASKNDNVKVIEKKLVSLIPKDKQSAFHLQMVLFGRYNCKAIKPNCLNCKLKNICTYKKEE